MSDTRATSIADRRQGDWQRHEVDDRAVDDLLDAAGRVFATVGVARATMVDVGREAGCARSTLYRYFESRDALHLAYVNRAALRIARTIDAEIGPANSTPAVLATRISLGVRAVRADPLFSVWFSPENMAVPIGLSRDSEVLAELTAGFTRGLDLPRWSSAERERRGRWLLRSIVSLLAMPPVSDDEERTLIERCIVPPLLDPRDATAGHPDDDTDDDTDRDPAPLEELP